MDIWVFIEQQWLLVGILTLLVAAFFTLERRRAGASISHLELARVVNANEAVMFDLRDSSEFKAGHIVDAINIPFAKLKDSDLELKKHKDKTLILIDKMGQHAPGAAKQLKEQGYIVVRLQGGMSEWQGQNMPVVKG
ncbi:rhodanese-like domain-containing protein [Agaribacterium sp. ZY112]|uniref:rhodanese-like domain-containing protein n=1 Tax=Agaribacterium sp. ZY112 TaxID=3233574 RepID=UPI003523A1E3